jgi:murein DD-endopeptidase MepM/ murein hydrolase activator NlpD
VEFRDMVLLAKFYSRIGGVVAGGQFRYGEDGWATDIYNQQLGVYERIAEAAKIVVKPGQTIKPGDLVAVGESGTGVIHYEIRKKVSGGFESTVLIL